MITDRARPYYAAMVDDLLEFYVTTGKHLNDTELFTQVSLRFGKRMLIEVCPHLDLDMGECSVGAIEVMREAAQRLVRGGMVNGE